MEKLTLAVLLAASAVTSPAFAEKPESHGAYKVFMGKVSPYLGQVEDVDLPS